MRRLVWMLALNSTALAQALLPVPDAQIKRVVPQDGALFDEEEREKLASERLKEAQAVFEENQRLKIELEEAKGNALMLESAQNQDIEPVPSEFEPFTGNQEVNQETSIQSFKDTQPLQSNPLPNIRRVDTPEKANSSGVQVFRVSESAQNSLKVLPAGSWVRAKLLTGVQANSKFAYSVLLQLDYAYTGPNLSKIPLQGCLIVGGATSDLSIERVIISPHTLSCVRDDGENIQRPVKGFVAGQDSSNGLPGVFDSKQSKVFLAAALAGIVKGASEAYEIAHTETNVLTSSAGSQAVTKNFTGEFRDLALAKGLGGPAEMVTQWYLEQAKSLLPTIHVGSGQDVWIIMTDRVDVPDLHGDF